MGTPVLTLRPALVHDDTNWCVTLPITQGRNAACTSLGGQTVVDLQRAADSS